jgi:hypothetical protein
MIRPSTVEMKGVLWIRARLVVWRCSVMEVEIRIRAVVRSFSVVVMVVDRVGGGVGSFSLGSDIEIVSGVRVVGVVVGVDVDVDVDGVGEGGGEGEELHLESS